MSKIKLMPTTAEEWERKHLPVSPELQGVYYVYHCMVDGIVRYVGMGKGNRISHCTSGKSSCSELNRDYHEGRILEVIKVKDKMTRADAQSLEMNLIWSYPDDQLYNKVKAVDLGSAPSIGRVSGVEILNVDDKTLLKQLVKVSPDLSKFDFDNLIECLHRCDLALYVAKVGSTQALVIDKPFSPSFDYLHLGCPNWPNCGAFGCGG